MKYVMANIQIPLEMEFDDNGEMTYNVLETHMKMEFQMIDTLPEKNDTPANQSLLELIESLGFKKRINTVLSNTDTTVSNTEDKNMIEPDTNDESSNNIVILKKRENTKKSLNKTFKNIMKKVRHITYKNYQ